MNTVGDGVASPLPDALRNIRKNGNLAGLAVEIGQGIAGLFGSSIGISAFDKMDFYSNNIGVRFGKALEKVLLKNPRYAWRQNWARDFGIFIRRGRLAI